jgi:hypothetical protein
MFDQMKSLIESLRFDIQSKDLSITNLKQQHSLKEESLTHDLVRITQNYEEIQEKLQKFEEKTRKTADLSSQKSFQSIQSLQKDVSESKTLIEKWKKSFYDLEVQYKQHKEESSQQFDDLTKEYSVKLKSHNESFIKQLVEMKNTINTVTNDFKKISTLFGKLGSKERHVTLSDDGNVHHHHRKENDEEEILEEITRILASLKTEHLDNPSVSRDISSSSTYQQINEEYTRLIKHFTSFVQRVLSARNHSLQTVLSLKEKTVSYDSLITTAFTEVETKVSAISQDIETSDSLVSQIIDILERNGLLPLKKGNGNDSHHDHHSHSHSHGSSSFISNDAFNELKNFHSKVIHCCIDLLRFTCFSFSVMFLFVGISPFFLVTFLSSLLVMISPRLSFSLRRLVET